MKQYKILYEFLLQQGHKFEIDQANFHNMMNSCGAVYATSGLSSLRKIPDNSVDFIFSQAVLEHIRKKNFLPTLVELHRILKPTGICTNEIDLRDHLSGSLNNLRFSELIWESDFFAKSGFYTNRIRFSEMIDLFRKTGFQVKIIDKKSWPRPPVAQHKLHREFQQLSKKDLSIASFMVALTPTN